MPFNLVRYLGQSDVTNQSQIKSVRLCGYQIFYAYWHVHSVFSWRMAVMICCDQSLTMVGGKNVCQHWIFYWHRLVPFVCQPPILVSPLQLLGIIGIIGSVWAPQVQLHCDIALPPRYTLCACPLSNLSQGWAVTDWINMFVRENRITDIGWRRISKLPFAKVSPLP